MTTLPPTTRIVDITSHAARMDEPLVSFRQVEAAGRSPAPAPAFLFGEVSAAAARAIYGQIETPQTGCYAIADAAVAPTGIALRQGVAFCGEPLNLPAEHVATIASRLNGAALPARFVPGPLVALFGPAEEAYGQLVIDYLPRLWLLEQAGHALPGLRFLLPATLPPRAEDVLGQLGLAHIVRYAHWEEVIHTDLLLLPTVLRRHERLSAGFGPATRFWVDRLRQAAGLDAPQPAERLYLCVQDGPRGADRLQAEARGRGFAVVHPETMDVRDRAALFGRASHIVGPTGAALHDSVFAAAGASVCGLRGAAHEGFLQTGLCAAMGQAVGYVMAGETDIARALESVALQGEGQDGLLF